MATIPNSEFNAPDGCTIVCGGVYVRIIASTTGVYVEAYREEDIIALVDEFVKYPEEKQE